MPCKCLTPDIERLFSPFQDAFAQTVNQVVRFLSIFQFQQTHIHFHITKFWATGSTTLFLLAESSSAPDSPTSTVELGTTLYTLPFAKSAVALLHSPVSY